MSKAEWRNEKRQRFGSIQEKYGKIYARFQYIDAISGKRKDKYLPAENRRHARQLLASLQQSIAAEGKTTRPEKFTFSDLAEKYSTTHLVPATYQNGIKVTGRRSLMPTLSSLKPLIEHFGRKILRNIKPSDLEEYKLIRLNTPVSIEVNGKVFDEEKKRYRKTKTIKTRMRKIASVNRELQLLRAMFNFANGEDLLMKNPFDSKNKIISTSAETHRDRTLSTDEESRLLAACTDRRAHLRPLVVVAVDTGMRRGELFKLTWADVDLAGRKLIVRASNAKTERKRIIGLSGRATGELLQLWNCSPKEGDQLVFGIRNTVKAGWKAACKEADIADLNFHDLRHTATTRLIRAGVPASEVMKITGHTQTATFLRYLNLTDESVSSSVALLDRYLSERPISRAAEELTN